MSIDRDHIVHYLIIVCILVLGFSLTLLFAANRELQRSVVVGFSLLYVLYGVFHHYTHHDVTIKIVVEYILIALLAVSLFFFVSGGS